MVLGKKGVVGIVGLGIMGGSFAQNLVAAGWRVIGYDIAPERRRAMARAGIEIAADAGEVARKAKTIITSLPSPKALAATVVARAFGLGRLVMMVGTRYATSPASSAISTPRRAMARRRAGSMS